MVRSANPALNDRTFDINKYNTMDNANHEVMTLDGTVTKSMILLFLLLTTSLFTWNMVYSPIPDLVPSGASNVMVYAIGGAVGGLIFALITAFKPAWSPVTAPVYALLEGLFLGAISAMFEMQFPGIVIQAVALTFGTFFALLMAYKSGLIKATENFKLGVVAATGGIALVYIASMVLGMFGVQIPMIHESGLMGIGFSLFVIVIAALNLVLDFDFIENGSESNMPKYMEWYGAFGLMVTLIWLYIEFLRLLAKLNSRN